MLFTLGSMGAILNFSSNSKHIIKDIVRVIVSFTRTFQSYSKYFFMTSEKSKSAPHNIVGKHLVLKVVNDYP